MSIPGSAEPLLLAQQDTGYKIERSLRFNSSDSAFCSRTFSSAGNRKTWTWAGWVKRSALGGDQVLFGGCPSPGGADNDHYGLLISGDALWSSYYTGSQVFQCVTSAVLRDTSAWYHITVAFDTTQATASNRIKIYVNGSLQSLSTANYPSLNYDGQINSAIFHSIGKHPRVSSSYLSGYLADVHFIDGQALDPSAFVETSGTTGQLIPKQYTGSFGTNGFWLKFSDNSAATATTLGKDYSGNSNNWTPNNLSVTAGAGNDSLVDTPSSGSQVDTGLGGQVTGNYCTLNPLAKGGDIQAPTNGNLQVTSSGSGYGLILGTIGMSSGKWYWEVTTTSANCATGIATNQANLASYGGADAYSWVWASYSGGSNKRNNNSNSSYGSILANGDVVGIAFDADNGTLTFYKNNVSQGAAYTGLATGTYLPVLGDETTAANIDLTVNFGQRQWAYAAPAGFKALCDTNLPAPVVAKPSTVMDVKLYTGNGSTQTISGLGFSPDLVWIKGRSAAEFNSLYDTIRGVNNRLFSNTTGAENTATTMTAFNADGFAVSTDGGTYTATNANATTYAAWAWDAGSSTVTNTQGSITSQVRANASAGFSIVTWTTSSPIGTVGHGLGVTPSVVIFKRRDSAQDWYFETNIVDGSYDYLVLNSTAAKVDGGPSWSSRATSTTITSFTGSAGQTYVAYCFAPVAGYSSMSSFVGNGSSDGPFQWCGFRPRWILLKNATTGGANYDWFIWDTARSSFNTARETLFANLSNAEAPTYITGIDVLSNGFKLRDGSAAWNGNGNTIVWAAFAESPFAYSRAR